MMGLMVAGGIAAGLGVGWQLLAWRQRQRTEEQRLRAAERIAAEQETFAFAEPAAASLPDFEHGLAVIDDFLPATAFERLSASLRGLTEVERSYIPGHKAGATLSYEGLHEVAPAAVALYRSEGLQGVVSRLVGEVVTPTPLRDQSSCSLLIYDRSDDHIGWHYDYNFYRGRHFTVLLVLENSGPRGLSCSVLQRRHEGRTVPVPTPSNTLVVFEGKRVFHRVTRLWPKERRVVLSMTYVTDSRSSVLQGVLRRIKDTAYYGPRALWT